MPTIEHVLFIPGIFLTGAVIGFFVGVKMTKAEIARREAERRQ